jgi:hypothetical protein
MLIWLGYTRDAVDCFFVIVSRKLFKKAYVRFYWVRETAAAPT